jgi:hypothetical protein
MKTLKLAAARTSGRIVSSTTFPANSSDPEDSIDAHLTTSSCVDNMSSSEKKSKSLDVLEQSRERLKKLMEQQTPSSSTESAKRLDGHLGSPLMEWQYQADSPWEKQACEKGIPKSVYTHNTVAKEPEKSNNGVKPVKDISSSEGSQCDDDHWDYADRSKSHKLDEWSDSKPQAQFMWSPDAEQHANTVPNKPSLSPTGFNRVPARLHSPASPLSQQSFASNSGKQTCTSPIKKSLPKLPTLYNVLKNPPAAGSKPLSDADIEELLEDTNRSESEPEKKEELAHMSLRAKLEQEIQQVHRVGVSKGGALRSLVPKDNKLKSPVKNVLDMMKPNSEIKKDRSPANRLQVSGKSDSVTGSALKANDEKEKESDIGQSRQIVEKDDNKNDFGNVKDTLSKPIMKDKKPTDPRRHASFSPRGEESCQNSLWEDVHPPAEGERKDPRVRLSTDLELNYDDPSSNNRDLSQGTTKKESSGILSSLSKEELQKIVEENLRNLPSPPPNTKEILETVNRHSPTAIKPVWQQPADIKTPLSSPKDYNQSDFMSPLHSSPYGSQVESHLGIGRNSSSYNPPFGVPRPDDRRPLLLTPNIPHDPRNLPHNINHDPRCSRDNQGPLSNIHDPRLNNSGYPHHDNYRSGILPHSPHDQYMRPVSNTYQSSHTPFHTNQTSHIQTSARWSGTPCYGVLSHSSPRLSDESYMHPGDSFPQHGPNSSRFQCSPHSSQHEFSQFQGQIRPLHDQFSGSHQQQPSWQSPPSSQGCFRNGSSANYPSSVRSVGQPVQHHGNSPHSAGKIPVGDSRLSNPQFTGHRLPLLPQSMTSSTSVRGSGVAGALSRAQSMEARSGNTLSERDPRRRRSIEEPEKRDCNSRCNRDSRKISSSSRGSNYGLGPERITERHSTNERRRDSDSRKFESSSSNRRRCSPEPNKLKETELVSPLNSLYDVASVPKTGKGYGFQKFRIPKIKRPSPPPKSKSPPLPKAKSPPPKLESSCTIGDTKEKDELAKPTDDTPVTKTEIQQSNLKDDASSSDVPNINVIGDDKGNVESVTSKNHENTSPGRSSDVASEKRSSGSKSKAEVTQEWIEALIRKSFESGEGKKFIEQAKLLEKLGESLKGKKLKKIQQILESDSDSGSDENTLVSSKKKEEENTYQDKEHQKVEEEGKLLKEDVSVEQNKKSKCHKVILSDDDQSTDSETLASKLKKERTVSEIDKPLSATMSKDKEEQEEEGESNKVEEGKTRKRKQNTLSDEAKPVRKYSKRRSALELLQEDIRDMFICEGVVTATGHRMCRLLKETPPGMTVDEISKSSVKRTEDEVSTTAEESDGSSVIGKRRLRKLAREKEFDKKEKEERMNKTQKMKLKMKEGVECGSEEGFGIVPNETDEKMTNTGAKKKDDSLTDGTVGSCKSPATKPRKKYEKSKWKGYVIEESEDSVEEAAVDKVDSKGKGTRERRELEACDKPPEQSYSCCGRRTRSKLNPANESETSNAEHGKRTRFPRVMLEKADISKLSLASSKPRTRYFEDSSSDESVVGDSTSNPVFSVKPKFKVAQKSRTKAKNAYHKRGRGGISKRGRKKHSKIERNDEASTDVESIVSDQSSIASSVSHQTNWGSTFTPIGFTFRRRYERKRLKFLGKKIDDIIKRLTKDVDSFKTTDITVNTTSSEEKLPESGRVDSSVEKSVAGTASGEIKEKENNVKIEGTSKSVTSHFDVPLAKPHGESESTGVPSVAKKRHSRIMLNLVRNSGVQKKVKKKKAKWQLGIISHTKKKDGIKFKSEVGVKDVIGSVTCENKVKELNKAVDSTNFTDECKDTEKDECEMSMNAGKEEDKLVSSKENITLIDDKLGQKIEIEQISETENNKVLHTNDTVETGDICAKKLVDEMACLDSKKCGAEMDKSPTVPDRSYALDGSAKYACKLCSTQCKSIVSHYKNSHPESEVLISRLREEEAAQAISEALESNYKEEEEEGNTKTGKRKRKQAGKFVCRICDHTATFAVNFYEHLSSHTGEYRFQCGKCSYEACTRHSVKGHFYHHHPELKGVESVSATVLAPGPPNDAKFVFGYICSLCNYVQLLKKNVERHISLEHPSESSVKLICINMSKLGKTPNDVAKDRESENMFTCEGTNEASSCIADKGSLGPENSNEEDVCDVSLGTKTEIVPEEDIKRSDSIATGIDATEQEPQTRHIDMDSKPFQAPDKGNMEKEQTSEIEQLGVCETHAENSVDSSCMLTSGKLTVVAAVSEKPGTISQELSGVSSADVDTEVGNVKPSREVAAEDVLDVEEIQLKQKIDDTRKNDVENTTAAIMLESSSSGAEEVAKEVDLKAFVCSDDLEEENSVIQKERLKKMEEIAKNLKDTHPKFLQSNRSSILDQLSDKLKTGFKSKTVDTTTGEKNDESVNPQIHSKEFESKESISQTGKVADVSTLIDEKRAIEAAQAVQNLLRAEKETVDGKQATGISQKISESPCGSKSGRHIKPCTLDSIDRRITRSFSKNEDGVDIETVDESSSDISFGFEGEDNEDIAESESQSPDALLNETLSALKNVSSRKSSRMFDIIERLASKVVPKTESSDMSDHPVEMDVPKPSCSTVISEDTICSSKDSLLEVNEIDGVKSVASKNSSNVIGKPPPLISLGVREKNMLRGTTGIGGEGSVSSVRVGPLEVRRFSEGLLYSCYIRGCIYASTNRALFANHIENTHKVSRWDGSCKACNNRSKGERHVKLSQALNHLIQFHLVASPNDLTTSSAVSGNEQDISKLSAEKSYVGEGEVSAERKGSEEMSTEKNTSAEQEEVSEKTSVAGGEVSNSNEGPTESSAPRKFIRLRRLSGDLLSFPKPVEDSVTTHAQQQAHHQDDIGKSLENSVCIRILLVS